MKHSFCVDGYSYSLRPVSIDDAAFIVKTRLEDMERNKFIHPISPDISLQEAWIENYYTIPGDYYFVIENKLTKQSEGVIAIYNVVDNKAEWGRWVVKKDSLASVESYYLICRMAFETLQLDELYSRTIENNTPVVNFHDKVKEKMRGILHDIFTINNITYNAIEHFVDKDAFLNDIKPFLEQMIFSLFGRNIKSLLGAFTFHHIGVASKDIDKEFDVYKLLGYKSEKDIFVDTEQGIKGHFIIADGQPRLELLQNLEHSHTLDVWVNNNIKLYHFAYCVKNIDAAIELFFANRAKIVAPVKKSVYFGNRVCFFMLSNMFMVELIEAKE